MDQNAEPLVEKVELYPYLEALWKARYFVLGLTFFAILLVFLVSRWFPSPVYEASGLVQVEQLGAMIPEHSDQEQNDQSKDFSLGSIEAYKSLMLSPDVLKPMQEKALRESTSIKAVAEIIPGSSIIKIKVQANSPEKAADLGMTWADTFSKTVEDIYLKKFESALGFQRLLEKEIKKDFSPVYFFEATGSRLSGDRVLFQENGDQIIQSIVKAKNLEVLIQQIQQNQLHDIMVISPIKANNESVAPRAGLNAVIAGFLGFIISVFLVFFKENWRGYKYGLLDGMAKK